MVGEPLTIYCIAITNTTLDVIFNWTGPGGGSISNNSRVTISPTTSSGDNYTSSLQFTYLMEGDDGEYTCNVSLLNVSASELVRIDTLNGMYVYYMCIVNHVNISVVPTPTVSVTALNNHTVGQSLTLQCSGTTVRGITSRVDIVWSSNGTVLERTDNVSSTTMGDSLVYTDYYNISQLSTTDDGRVIQCEVTINTIPSVMASESITLDVISK